MTSSQTKTTQKADLEAVVDALRAHDRFLVTTHENPDGDALGSLLSANLALEQLGATFTHGKMIEMRVNGFRGADVFLDEPSVTATENALVAAAAATGTTVLRNAASEPHVQDLAHFLIALGAEQGFTAGVGVAASQNSVTKSSIRRRRSINCSMRASMISRAGVTSPRSNAASD